MADEMYHGAKVEFNGGNRRLSAEQPQMQNAKKKEPKKGFLIAGVVFLVVGTAAGVFGLPIILFGMGFMAAYAASGARRGRAAAREEKTPTVPRQENPVKADIRRKEKTSYRSSATYREHYGHREEPQKPIDWSQYREHIGPSPEQRRQQAKTLYDGGLLTKEEYMEKLRQIENR